MMRNVLVALSLTAFLAGCGETGTKADPVATATGAAASVAATSPAPIAPVATPAPAPSPEPKIALSGPAKVPDRLQALGTEPFWSVQINGVNLRYSTPDDQAGKALTTTREDTVIASTFSGRLAGKPFELSIVPEKCSDGMSDTEYPFSAWLTYAGERHHGCARKPT
jgi:uncharacterized membrane protein